MADEMLTYYMAGETLPTPMAGEAISNNMDAQSVFKACEGQGLFGVGPCNIANDTNELPTPPDPPNVRLTDEELRPPVPTVHPRSKADVESEELRQFCMKHPIAVVRDLALALELDLGLFSTKTLVATRPDQKIEVRNQKEQAPDENWDPNVRGPGWSCSSHRSFTNIKAYAEYQAKNFKERAEEEKSSRVNQAGSSTSEGSDAKESLGNTKKRKSSEGSGSLKPRPRSKYLKFATNGDLSNEKIWMKQLLELNKLPVFAKVRSAANMLSHVGHVILGVNTVQLYMKVPGCRTTGHQESNNVCSVNINVGPGDCEWFAVPLAYWGVIYKLCEKHGINFLTGTWWPDLKDLMKEKVPVYRFLQHPGDMVWVNSGCVHWVQSAGWGNSIAWNVAPLTASQFQMAIERYEFNKLHQVQSIIPMVHLTWNLARNVLIDDPELFAVIKNCMIRTLRHYAITLEFLRSKGVAMQYHGRVETDPSYYCETCEAEVFGLLFIRPRAKSHVVYCLYCAQKQRPNFDGFACLEEFRDNELSHIFDNFKLHVKQNQQSSKAEDAA